MKLEILFFHKYKDSNKWKGPGKVIDKEDNQILVKHDRHYIRINPCSLQLIDDIGHNKSEI